MFHCPAGVWVIEQHAIILSATVRSPTVNRPPENSEGNSSLVGFRPEQAGDLYLENIRRRPGDRLKDIANRVGRHAYQNGLHIMAARMIVLRHCDDVLGCKIVVPVLQIEDALGNRIWSTDVTCRRWRPRRNPNQGRPDTRGREEQWDDERNEKY